MATKKLSLYKQAQIELKRRQLRVGKAGEYNPKRKFTEQLRMLLPNITWKEKQGEFLNAKQFISWYLGGYKSGKTFTGCAADIGLAYYNRPYPGILVHPTMDGNEITILPALDEICEINNIEYEVKTLRTKFKVIFKFGINKKDWGTLYLASGDNPKSLKGPKLAWGHVDEPLIMKEEITEVIMSRLAEARGTVRRLMFTGTPEPNHMQWGFDIVDKEFEDTDKRFITTVSTREVAMHLAPGYIEEMEKNLTPEQIETFIEGKYRNLSQGKVYTGFDRNRNVWDPVNDTPVRNFPPDAEKELVLSFDFNVNQMSAALHELAYRTKTQVEEYRIRSRSNTKELTVLALNRMMADGYLTREGGEYTTKHGRSLIITGDASGRAGSTKSNLSDYDLILNTLDEFKVKYTIYVPEANPAIRDRVNYVNQQFENETYYISNKCPIAIRDRELMSWKLGADGFFIDKSKKELTHMGDAADYGVYNTQILTSGEEGVDYGVRTIARPKRYD